MPSEPTNPKRVAYLAVSDAAQALRKALEAAAREPEGERMEGESYRHEWLALAIMLEAAESRAGRTSAPSPEGRAVARCFVGILRNLRHYAEEQATE